MSEAPVVDITGGHPIGGSFHVPSRNWSKAQNLTPLVAAHRFWTWLANFQLNILITQPTYSLKTHNLALYYQLFHIFCPHGFLDKATGVIYHCLLLHRMPFSVVFALLTKMKFVCSEGWVNSKIEKLMIDRLNKIKKRKVKILRTKTIINELLNIMEIVLCKNRVYELLKLSFLFFYILPIISFTH